MITGIIIGVPIGCMLGIVVMALLSIAKQTNDESGIEPSLGQEDNFIFLENAEEMEERE